MVVWRSSLLLGAGCIAIVWEEGGGFGGWMRRVMLRTLLEKVRSWCFGVFTAKSASRAFRLRY